MNKTLNKKLIEKFKYKVCPIHGKAARLETKNNIIVIGDFCCSEFYAIRKVTRRKK